MSADRDRGIRRQKQKRAKDTKRAKRDAWTAIDTASASAAASSASGSASKPKPAPAAA